MMAQDGRRPDWLALSVQAWRPLSFLAPPRRFSSLGRLEWLISVVYESIETVMRMLFHTLNQPLDNYFYCTEMYVLFTLGEVKL
jgi:hypothetical protein